MDIQERRHLARLIMNKMERGFHKKLAIKSVLSGIDIEHHQPVIDQLEVELNHGVNPS